MVYFYIGLVLFIIESVVIIKDKIKRGNSKYFYNLLSNRKFLIFLFYSSTAVTVYFIILKQVTFLPGKDICNVCSVSPYENTNTILQNIPNSFISLAKISIETFPAFFMASFIGAFIKIKYYKYIPTNVFTSILFGALLPVCSCGIIPIVQGLIKDNYKSKVSAMAMLLVAPTITPLSLIIGYQFMGLLYIIVRFVTTVAFVLIAAPIVAKFADSQKAARSMPRSVQDPYKLGFLNIRTLWKYVALGIMISVLAYLLLPLININFFAENSTLSLLLLNILGIPMNMSSGQDIFISMPFYDYGTPMGTLIAFAITTTGICLTSIPIIFRVFGKKAGIVTVLVFLIIPPLLGAVVNVIYPHLSLWFNRMLLNTKPIF